MPVATRPTSPIQRLSKAYLRKKAVAKRISDTATQPIHRRPIIDSRSYALKEGTFSIFLAGSFSCSGVIGSVLGSCGGGVSLNDLVATGVWLSPPAKRSS